MTRPRLMILAASAIAILNCISTSSAMAAVKKAELVREGGGQLLQNAFTGKSLLGSKVETGAKRSITCTALTFEGNMSTTKAGTAVFRLTGCKGSGGLNCNTAGQTSGVMVVRWTLEVVNESKEEPNKEKDYFFVNVTETAATCGTAEVTVKGGFLIPTTPENSAKRTYTFDAIGKEGKQTPELPGAGELELKPGREAMFESASLNAEGLETTFEENAVFI